MRVTEMTLFLGIAISSVLCAPLTAIAFIPCSQTKIQVKPLFRSREGSFFASLTLNAYHLNTAWEWLAEHRMEDEAYHNISWINTQEEKDYGSGPKYPNEEEIVLPLYPLPDVHLPIPGVNHTLNNVEPRNIQMAQDLINNTAEKDRRFCVVLRAMDTGRIASVGTIMTILDSDIQYWPDGSVSRIVITCHAENLADIMSLENIEAESRRNKLMKSPEYLRARVVVRRRDEQKKDNDSNASIKQLLLDYKYVKMMYVDGVGQAEIPAFAREGLFYAMPDWNKDDFANENSFWRVAHAWQTLCNTVREGRQIMLSADRNELMIAEASKKGGPLKLPIHMEDLTPSAQKQLQLMEVERQNEFVFFCRMDPVLDFLALTTMGNLSERTKFLARMVSRERQRLTKLALSEAIQEQQGIQSLPSRKGAWFEGFE